MINKLNSLLAKRMRQFYPILLLCITFIIFQACKKDEKTQEIQPIDVKTILVGEQSFKNNSNVLSATGRIAADKNVKLSFQVSGTIEQFPVKMGEYVKQNDLIASIDATTYQKQYETQKAQADLAEDNYARVKEVYEKGSIAEVRMVEARSNYQQAQAAAEASYQNVKHTSIRAPFSGYVGEKMMEAGDLASPGQPVVYFFNIDKLKAIIPIPDDEINQYEKGDKAVVKVDALNKEYEGEITEISVQTDSSNPTYTAQISINNPTGKIKPGMTCTVSILEKLEAKEESSATIIVPVETVSVTDGNENFVYVVNNQNKAKRRIVKTGKLTDEGIAITEGLKNGEQLITSGYHKLTENTPVNIVNK